MSKWLLVLLVCPTLAFAQASAPGGGGSSDYRQVVRPGSTGTTIQSKIDDASNTKSVFLPGGSFTVTKPLRISTGGARVVGDGKSITQITASGYRGPVVAMGHLPDIPFGPALFTDATRSFDLREDDFFLDLRDAGASGYPDNWAEFEIDFSYQPKVGGADDSYGIIGCRGRLMSSDTESITFQVLHQASNGILGVLTVGGVEHSLTAAGVLTPGSTARIRLNYDGSTVRLYVNGSVVDSEAASGAVTMTPYENCTIGGLYRKYPNQGNVASGPQGYVDGFRLSKNAFSTGNYTPATVKPEQANTDIRLVVNADDVDGTFAYYRTVDGPVYSPARFLEYVALDAIRLENLKLVGGGVWMNAAQSSRLENIYISNTQWGVTAYNNCYLSTFDNVRIVTGSTLTKPQYGLALLEATGVTKISNIHISSAYLPLVVSNSSVQVSHAYLVDSTDAGMYLDNPGNNPGAVGVFQDMNIVDENTTMTRAVLIDAVLSATFLGGSFQTAGASSRLPIRIDGDPGVTMVGPQFAVHASAASVFEIDGTQTKPISLVGPIIDNVIPWGDVTGKVSVITQQNRKVSLTIEDTDTEAVWTFVQEEPDTDYVISCLPAAKTGSPATNSALVDAVTKDTTSATVSLVAAPGAGTSRTLDCTLIR